MEDNYSYLEDDDEQVPRIRQVNKTDQPDEHRRSIGEHQGSNMKYLIIGAGGTGGILGYKMAKGGLDVTMIARGKQLRAIWGNGILVEQQWDHNVDSAPVKAYDTSNYYDDPDVIFLCVKSYSVKSLLPFLRQIVKNDTIVIPTLNVYGTGEYINSKLSKGKVMDGCMYASANIKSSGWILIHRDILRVIFGPREPKDYDPRLLDIERDLISCGIDAKLSDTIQRECMEKFSYISPIAAAGAYYNATVADFQRTGEPRAMLKTMIREIMTLSYEMGYPFEKDYVDENLKVLESLPPDATTRMQRDVAAGRKSEIDGLVFNVIRMAKKYNVPMPAYEMVAEELEKKYIQPDKKTN